MIQPALSVIHMMLVNPTKMIKFAKQQIVHNIFTSNYLGMTVTLTSQTPPTNLQKQLQPQTLHLIWKQITQDIIYTQMHQ